MPVDREENEIQEFSDKSIDDSVQVKNIDTLVEPDEPNSDNINIYIASQIITTWAEQHQSDIRLRKKFAKYLLILLLIETIIVMGVFVGVGLRWLAYSENTVQLFLTLSIGQIVGAIFIIVKYLFSKDSHVILRDVAEVLGHLRKQ